MMEELRAEHLTVSYNNNGSKLTALKDVTFTVDKGEICSVIGPSGCGKTTLLYILAGIIKDYEGKVSGNDFRNVGMILQDYGLLPWKTVWQNVVLGLEIRKERKDIIRLKGQSALCQVGMEKFRNMYPSQLSGGQRQRVGIARALSMDVALLLMDEPFSALDSITREEMQTLFLNIWEQTKMTVMFVTHNIEEAVYLGNKIILMTPAPGRIAGQFTNSCQGDAGARARSGTDFFHMCSVIRSQLRHQMYGEVYEMEKSNKSVKVREQIIYHEVI